MAITSYKAVVGYYNSAGTPNIVTAVTGQLADGWLPIGSPILTDTYGQCTQMMAKTDATGVTTSAYTVVTAGNPQPPDATWDAQGEPIWLDTATYLQAYTKGGAYLQGVVPLASGGTGATTASGARTNLGLGALATKSLATIGDGGTGATTIEGIRTNLDLGSVSTFNILPVDYGGTGATTASGARTNLGLGTLATKSLATIGDGGTGATTASGARTNLGLKNGASLEFRYGTVSATGTKYFDTPFPNACYGVFFCPESTYTEYVFSAQASDINRSNFFFLPNFTDGNTVPTTGNPFRYIAIGD